MRRLLWLVFPQHAETRRSAHLERHCIRQGISLQTLDVEHFESQVERADGFLLTADQVLRLGLADRLADRVREGCRLLAVTTGMAMNPFLAGFQVRVTELRSCSTWEEGPPTLFSLPAEGQPCPAETGLLRGVREVRVHGPRVLGLEGSAVPVLASPEGLRHVDGRDWPADLDSPTPPWAALQAGEAAGRGQVLLLGAEGLLEDSYLTAGVWRFPGFDTNEVFMGNVLRWLAGGGR